VVVMGFSMDSKPQGWYPSPIMAAVYLTMEIYRVG